MSQFISSAIPSPDVVVPPTGLEWIIDAHHCDEHRLRDVKRLTQLCQDVIGDLDLCVVGRPQIYAFPSPGGVTALYLLSESHLTFHTYPEYATATFNLYCCRQRPAWAWQQELAFRIGASSVRVQTVMRGQLPDAESRERGL